MSISARSFPTRKHGQEDLDMRLFRMGTVALLAASVAAGCSRPQPAASDAAQAESTPANSGIQKTAAKAPSPEEPRVVDPLRVKARSVMFVLGYGAYKYKQEHGEFPKSLGLLVAREADLLDPWGHPYHYYAQESRHNRDKPDIWSEGADPHDPHAVLANWDDGED
jgi:hypothetical protein